VPLVGSSRCCDRVARYPTWQDRKEGSPSIRMTELRETVPDDEEIGLIVEIADRQKFGDYLTIDYQDTDDALVVGLRSHGQGEIRSFRTLRGATEPLPKATAMKQVVLLLELTLLPVVLPEATLIERRRGFSEAAFAERQAELWTKRAERLMKADSRESMDRTTTRVRSTGEE